MANKTNYSGSNPLIRALNQGLSLDAQKIENSEEKKTQTQTQETSAQQMNGPFQTSRLNKMYAQTYMRLADSAKSLDGLDPKKDAEDIVRAYARFYVDSADITGGRDPGIYANADYEKRMAEYEFRYKYNGAQAEDWKKYLDETGYKTKSTIQRENQQAKTTTGIAAAQWLQQQNSADKSKAAAEDAGFDTLYAAQEFYRNLTEDNLEELRDYDPGRYTTILQGLEGAEDRDAYLRAQSQSILDTLYTNAGMQPIDEGNWQKYMRDNGYQPYSNDYFATPQQEIDWYEHITDHLDELQNVNPAWYVAYKNGMVDLAARGPEYAEYLRKAYMPYTQVEEPVYQQYQDPTVEQEYLWSQYVSTEEGAKAWLDDAMGTDEEQAARDNLYFVQESNYFATAKDGIHDFDKKAQYDPNISVGGSSFVRDVYKIINTDDEYEYAMAVQRHGTTTNTAAQLESLAGYMKPEEKALFNALIAEGRYEDAERYANYLYYDTAARENEYFKTWAKEAAGGGWLAQVGMSALSVPTSLLRGKGALEVIMQNIANGIAPDHYKPINYDAAFSMGNLTDATRQAVMDNVTWAMKIFGHDVDLFDFIYGTAMSGVDSLAASMSGQGWVAAAMLGTGAAQSTMNDLHERGGSDQQIAMGGLLAGVFETLFEKVSIGHFYEDMKVLGGEGKLRYVKNILAEAGINFTEEFATEVADILVADMFVMGGKSDAAQKFDYYVSHGLTEDEARARVAGDLAFQAFEAGAGGFLMGGVFGGIADVGSAINTSRVSKQVGKNLSQENRAGMWEAAKSMGDTRANKIANKTTAETMTDKQAGAMFLSLQKNADMSADFSPEIKKSIWTAVKRSVARDTESARIAREVEPANATPAETGIMFRAALDGLTEKQQEPTLRLAALDLEGQLMGIEDADQRAYTAYALARAIGGLELDAGMLDAIAGNADAQTIFVSMLPGSAIQQANDKAVQGAAEAVKAGNTIKETAGDDTWFQLENTEQKTPAAGEVRMEDTGVSLDTGSGESAIQSIQTTEDGNIQVKTENGETKSLDEIDTDDDTRELLRAAGGMEDKEAAADMIRNYQTFSRVQAVSGDAEAQALDQSRKNAEQQRALEAKKAERDAYQEELDKTTKEVKEIQASIDQVTKEMDDAKAELEKIEGERDEAISASEEAQRALSAAKKEEQAAREDLDQKQAALNQIKADDASTQQQISEAEANIDYAQDRLSTIQADVQDKTIALYDAQAKAEELKEQLQTTQGDIASLDDELKTKEYEKASKETALQKTINEIALADQELTAAKGNLENIQRSYAQMERDALETTAVLEEAQEKLTNAQTELESVQADLAAAEEEAAQKSLQLSALQADAGSTDAEIREAEAALEDADVRKKALETELELLKQEVEAEQDELDELNKVLQSISNEIQAAREQGEGIEREYRQAIADRDAKQKELDDAKKELETIDKQLEDTKKKIQAYPTSIRNTERTYYAIRMMLAAQAKYGNHQQQQQQTQKNASTEQQRAVNLYANMSLDQLQNELQKYQSWLAKNEAELKAAQKNPQISPRKPDVIQRDIDRYNNNIALLETEIGNRNSEQTQDKTASGKTWDAKNYNFVRSILQEMMRIKAEAAENGDADQRVKELEKRLSEITGVTDFSAMPYHWEGAENMPFDEMLKISESILGVGKVPDNLWVDRGYFGDKYTWDSIDRHDNENEAFHIIGNAITDLHDMGLNYAWDPMGGNYQIDAGAVQAFRNLIAQNRGRAAELSRAVDYQEAQKKAAEERVKKAQELGAEAIARVQQLGQQYWTESESLEEAKRQMGITNAELENTNREKEKTKQELDEVNRRKAELEKQLGIERDNLENLQQGLYDIKTEIATKEGEKTAAEKELKDRQAELDAVKAAYESVQSDYQTALDDLEKKKTALENVRLDTDKTEEEQTTAEEALAAAESAYQTKKENLENTKKELVSIQADLNEKETGLDEAKKDLAEKDKELQQLQAQQTGKESELEAAKKTLADTENVVKQAEEEEKKKREELSAYQSRLDDLNNQLAETAKKQQEQQEKLDTARAALSDLEQQTKEKEQQAGALMREGMAKGQEQENTPHITATDYTRGYIAIYEAAKAGKDISSLYGDLMTEEQRQAARQAGERARAQEQQQIKQQTQALAKAEGLQVLDETTGDQPGVYIGQSSRTSLTDGERIQLKALNEAGQKYGLQVVVVDHDSQSNGYYVKGTNRVVVALDAEEGALTRVMSHEAYHFIQQYSPGSAQQIRDAVHDALVEGGFDWDGRVAQIQERYANAGQTLTTAEAEEEIVGESLLDQFATPGFLETIAKKDMSLVERIGDWVQKAYDWLQGLVQRYAANHSPEARKMLELRDQFGQISGMFQRALANAGNNYRMTSVGRSQLVQNDPAVRSYQKNMQGTTNTEDAQAEVRALVNDVYLRAEKGWISQHMDQYEEGAEKFTRALKAYTDKENPVALSVALEREGLDAAPYEMNPVITYAALQIREAEKNWGVKFNLRDDTDASKWYDAADVRYSMRVTDADELEFLEGQETVTTYKTMQLIDGHLYPPMAAVVAGNMEDYSELGAWEKAVEHPELIREGNKFTLNKGRGQGSLQAAYNPYMHSSNLMINDQFSGAWNRPNLVTVECEVPVSELTSGYHAENAKDSVGWHSWHTGTVAGQLRQQTGTERQVLLSRWIKPVRIVPDAEVAQHYAQLLEGTDIQVPDNVVTPGLLEELRKTGVPIKKTGKVKSADPVTYDDNGEIIPPSQRFNTKKNDIRYNLRSEAFDRWFGNSQVVNEDGSPKVMYHGTASDFWAFDMRKSDDKTGRMLGLGAGKGKIYLTEYEASARAAASSAAARKGGGAERVLELYVSAQKVMDRAEYNARLEAAYAKYPKSRPHETGYDYRQRDKAIAEVDRQIRREGYDGVWDRDSGEMFVFEPTQVKSATDNVGTYDPNNPDIRYSLRDTEDTAAEDVRLDPQLYAQAMSDEEIRNALESAGRLYDMIHGLNIRSREPDVWKRWIRDIVRQTLNRVGSNYGARRLTADLTQVFEAIDRGGYNGGELLMRLREIGLNVLEATPGVLAERDETTTEVLRELRNHPFYLTEDQKADIRMQYGSVRTFMNKNFGKMRIRKKGNTQYSLQEFWNEVLNPLLPGTFAEDTIEADMPSILDAFLETAGQKRYNGEFGGNIQRYATSLGLEMLSDYMNAPWITEQLDALREQVDVRATRRAEAAARRYEDIRQRAEAAQADLREKTEQIRQHYQQRYNERIQRSQQRRQDTEARQQVRNQITRTVRGINTMNINPTNQRHVPTELRDAALAAVQPFLNETGVFSRTEIDRLAREYAILRERGDVRGVDNDIYESILTLPGILNGRRLSDLTLEELNQIKDIVGNLRLMIQSQNEARVNGRQTTVDDLSERLKSDMRAKGDSKTGKAASFFRGLTNLETTPVYFADRVGGVLKDMMGDFFTGEETWAFMVENATQYAEEMAEKYHANNWINDKNHLRFVTARGEQIELSKREALSLYATWKRENTNKLQNAQHLRVGGFTYGKKANYKGVDTRRPHILSQSDMDRITAYLGEEGTSFADEMVKYLSSTLARQGNEVSEALYGYQKFNEGYYFPYSTDSDYLVKNLALTGGEQVKLPANQGFTKAVLQHAATPVEIGDFMSTWSGHVNSMALFCGFGESVDTMNRVLNSRLNAEVRVNPETNELTILPMESVRAEVKRALGDEGMRYLETLVRDISGGMRPDERGIFGQGLGMFKKAAVAANLSVVVQQPMSVARALMMMNPKYFLGLKPAQIAKNVQEMYEHSGVALIKKMGRFDTGTGSSAREYLSGAIKDESRYGRAMDQVDKWAGMGAEKADEWTWGFMWGAVKNEIEAKMPELTPGSQEYWKAVTDRFNDIVRHTQVYDSVMSRSEWMRSQTIYIKMVTAFKAEPTLTMNMLMNAAENMRKPGGMRKFTRATAVFLLNAALIALVKSMVTAARKKGDEKRTFGEKYWGEVVNNFTEDITPAGILSMIPIIGDAISLFKDYDVARTDMDAIKQLKDAYKTVTNDNKSDVEKIASVASAVSNLFGIPLKNVYRDSEALIRNIFLGGSAAESGSPSALKYTILENIDTWPVDVWDESRGAYYDRLVDALEKGDSKGYDEIYQYMTGTSGVKEDTVSKGMKDVIKKRYLAGQMTETDAQKFLEQQLGDKQAYWTVKKWTDGENKYDDFYAAVESGNDLRKVIKTYTDNGVSTDTLASQITTYYKPLYIAAYKRSRTEAANLKARILTAYELLGKDRNQKIKDIDKWLED